MNFNEFISKHPGIESDAAAMSLHSYMQGAQDARQIDTNCMSSILNAGRGLIKNILQNRSQNPTKKFPERGKK
jgi:hypothetical protein